MAQDGMRVEATTGQPQARFLTRREASAYLWERHQIQRSPRTLQKLASLGGGPLFRKIGRQPVYTPRDLDRWARALVSPPLTRARDLKIARAETQP